MNVADGAGWFSRPETKKPRYIGISMLTLTPELVEAIRLRDSFFPNVSQGVLIERVTPYSPAER